MAKWSRGAHGVSVADGRGWNSSGRKMVGVEALERRTLLAGIAFDTVEVIDVGGHPKSVATGDFNSDGVIDLATLDSGDDTVRVLLGNGDGTFEVGRAVGTGEWPYVMTAGDLNGDGCDDIVTVNGDSRSVGVLLGNGDGTFGAMQRIDIGEDGREIALGDVNGDGKTDMVVAVVGSDLVLLPGNGDGTFQARRNLGDRWGIACNGLAIGDLNGDNINDLLVAGGGSSSVAVHWGNGGGTFRAEQYVGVDSVAGPMIIADLNRDGNRDLVTLSGGGSVCVWLGNGRGAFQTPQKFSAGTRVLSVAVGDLNRDGKDDLVAADDYCHDISVLMGNGNGAFPARCFYTNAAVSMVEGDFNEDGRRDVVVSDGDSTKVLLGRGDGTFGPCRDAIRGGTSCADAVVGGDFNGDGHSDLVITDVAGSALTVLLGRGDGTFRLGQRFGVTHAPSSVVTGDLNGDGISDLVTADTENGAHVVSVLLGNGDGTLQSASDLGIGGGVLSIALGDFNGDGYSDLVTAYPDDGIVGIWLGAGDGTFQPRRDIAVDDEVWSLVVGDLNGDGHCDLVTHAYNNTIGVLLGRGDATFQVAHAYTVGSGTKQVVIDDINDDGKADLLVAYDWNQSISVLLGDGRGAFQSGGELELGYYSVPLLVDDFSGDGKDDLVTGSSGVTVLLNTTPSDLSWKRLSVVPNSLPELGGTLGVGRSFAVSPWAVNTSFAVEYRLSSDQVWGNGDDVVLGSETIGGAGASVGVHGGSVRLHVGRMAVGTYYLLAKLDAGGVVEESDEENNVIVSGQIEITAPVFGAVNGKMHVMTVPDADGDLVTFTLRGGGTGELTGENLDLLTLTGTTARSVLTISVKRGKGGDGLFHLSGISSDGLMRSIAAGAVVVGGDVSLDSLGQGPGRRDGVSIRLGQMVNGSINTGLEAVGALTLMDWSTTDGETHTLTVPAAGRILVTGRRDDRRTRAVNEALAGNLQADVVVAGGRVGRLQVAGEISGSVRIGGSVGTIWAGSFTRGTVRVQGNVGMVSVGAMVESHLLVGVDDGVTETATRTDQFVVGEDGPARLGRFVVRGLARGGGSYPVAVAASSVSAGCVGNVSVVDLEEADGAFGVAVWPGAGGRPWRMQVKDRNHPRDLARNGRWSSAGGGAVVSPFSEILLPVV